MVRKRSQRSPEAVAIRSLVKHYIDNSDRVEGFLKQVLVHLSGSKNLARLVHTFRSRVKDPQHLQDKLQRKAREAREKGTAFDITTENLFTKITDLAGVRILHLHTTQFAAIDAELRSIFAEQNFVLVEGPFARTWDDEYRDYFASIDIKTEESPTLYTSVHYVIASGSRTTITCEIQVRTLAEELWGEVDHTLNYPHPSDSVACKEQIRALARATSTATRLVDAIFATKVDQEAHAAKRIRSNRRSPARKR